MPRKRQLHDRINERLQGRDPKAEEQAATAKAEAEKSATKLTGSPAEVVAKLSPAQREALFEALDELRFDDFKTREELEAEESEDV